MFSKGDNQPEKFHDDVIDVLNWSRNQKFLPNNLTEAFIETFLLGCQGKKDFTKTVLENYFYARQSTPEIFTKRDPLLKENIQIWKSSCFIPLPEKQDGCMVFLGTALNSENYNFVNFVKQIFMCFDLLIKNNEWGNGDSIIIISYDKITYENLPGLTIYMTRKLVECGREDFLPGKRRTVHNVHIPPFMSKIHARFQPYLKKEEERGILFHRSLRSLYKFVNQDILPLEYGGTAGPLKTMIDNWCSLLKANRLFFLEEEENRMKEAKTVRP